MFFSLRNNGVTRRKEKHTHDDGENKGEAVFQSKERRDSGDLGQSRQGGHAEETIVIVTKPACTGAERLLDSGPCREFADGVREVDVLFLCAVGVGIEDIYWWRCHCGLLCDFRHSRREDML